MNNPQNPLVPQGSLLEQKNQGRARVKIAVFVVLAVHGIGLMALLMAGCRREEPQPAVPDVGAVETTGVDTNQPAPFADPTNTVDSMLATDTNVLAGTNQQTGFVTPTDTNIAPAATNPPLVGVTAGPTTEYAVMKGDSFATIAKKFHVTTKAVQDANPGVEPTKLQIGQKIQVPAPTPSTGATAPTTAPVSGGTITYTVKSGDTLSSIATAHKTTVSAIRRANSLKTDFLKVDQKLQIPVKAP